MRSSPPEVTVVCEGRVSIKDTEPKITTTSQQGTSRRMAERFEFPAHGVTALPHVPPLRDDSRRSLHYGSPKTLAVERLSFQRLSRQSHLLGIPPAISSLCEDSILTQEPLAFQSFRSS